MAGRRMTALLRPSLLLLFLFALVSSAVQHRRRRWSPTTTVRRRKSSTTRSAVAAATTPRFYVSHIDSTTARPSTPPGDWIDITDYNVSTDGSRDVSSVIDQIGGANTHGATLFFPGRLGGGGAAAGWLPSKYLIDPQTRCGGARRGTRPRHSPCGSSLVHRSWQLLALACTSAVLSKQEVIVSSTRVRIQHRHKSAATARMPL